jgi:hypothetical protein
LLQCGNIVAADALLGRFLPRLGPLVATQAASLHPTLKGKRVWPAFSTRSCSFRRGFESVASLGYRLR